MLYLVLLDGVSCCSAHCTGRFMCDDYDAASFLVNEYQKSKRIAE